LFEDDYGRLPDTLKELEEKKLLNSGDLSRLRFVEEDSMQDWCYQPTSSYFGNAILISPTPSPHGYYILVTNEYVVEKRTQEIQNQFNGI